MASKIRERIIDAAGLCFTERGFSATSTKTIAKRAGVNETSIFRLFKSKRRLFQVVFDDVTKPFTDLFTPLAANPDFNAAVHRFAIDYCALLDRRMVFMEYVSFLEFPELIVNEARPWMAQFLEVMRKRIADERRAGRAHRHVNSDSAAVALNNILYHYKVQVYSYKYAKGLPFFPQRKAIQLLVDAWLCGVIKSK